MKTEDRTTEQISEHYKIEKALADKLRNSSKEERPYLYSYLYDELYRRVPLHPQLTRKSSPVEKKFTISSQMKILKPYLNKDITFMEIGPGDCSLSFELTKFAKQVYAVDVSYEITRNLTQPPNFDLILSDGSSIVIPPNSIDLAYSNQLMEHLHPDDAFDQLKNIYHSLTTGGIYICITPNRLSGPHDISKYFDKEATGFHLKEYTTFELSSLFRKVGLLPVRVYLGGRGKYLRLPISPIILYETLLAQLPYRLRKSITRILPFRLLLGIGIIGIKYSSSS